MVSHAVWKTWPSGLSYDKNLGLRPRFLSTESLGPCFSHGMGDHDQILQHIPSWRVGVREERRQARKIVWPVNARGVICRYQNNLCGIINHHKHRRYCFFGCISRGFKHNHNKPYRHWRQDSGWHVLSIVTHATAWRRELSLYYTSRRQGQPLQFRAKNPHSHVIMANVHCTGTGTCKEPAMSTFVFFVIILNTPLYKEPSCRKFETPLCSYGSVHTKISIFMDAITPGRVNRWNDKKFIDIQCMYLKNQPNFPVLLDEFLLLYYNLIVNKWIIYIRKYLYLPFLWKSNRNIYYQSRLQIS